ncbi:MAG: DUF3341 domain-containing protein [Spirosomataceae bacterium]
MATNNKFLVGVYDDEDVVLSAVGKVKGSGVTIHEVYTPFAIHGLDKAIGHPRTRIPIAAFILGACGTTFALFLTIWTMGIDWPIIIGGKDFIAFPDFVPVIFEMTVLVASYGMAFTFFLSNGLWWGTKPKSFDLRATDDKFIMAIDLGQNKLAEADIEKTLKESGAIEVNVKQF